jgi:Ca2+-dependent lipid-binding protein
MYMSIVDAEVHDEPAEKVSISVSCRDLKNMDTFSRSDPFVTLYVKDKRNRWREFGRTEQIEDNLNPDFEKHFELEYRFEIVQELRFEVWDDDGHGHKDSQGFIETTLGRIMGAKQQT